MNNEYHNILYHLMNFVNLPISITLLIKFSLLLFLVHQSYLHFELIYYFQGIITIFGSLSMILLSDSHPILISTISVIYLLCSIFRPTICYAVVVDLWNTNILYANLLELLWWRWNWLLIRLVRSVCLQLNLSVLWWGRVV